MTKKNYPETSFFRRKYLINRGFQIRFIAYTIGIALAVILTVFLTSNYFFWAFAERGKSLGLDESHVFYVFLGQQQSFMNQLLVGLSVFYFFLLSGFGLVLSHRVAGPMHRLNRHMLSVAKGEVTSPLSFRKNDYFQELSLSYNAQYEYLKYGINATNRKASAQEHESSQLKESS
ncbi:hypothetical protein [Pseudobacteriovorax antillogorgiicola]|uniref:HAMP domain-containing protein n=1 Tax=Pseudobacteriovorax antillogorgiicola TaxID=1513793 RepID=A0A1Y6CMA9_9BACT|nr:hypothetical protein [Pseudobacteriovorax antillogorgiicola]TCS47651.1 hypothetical protein EDD56_12092 [Pseudobacteriovorax antillogorgiicola]SMF59832.1 hypothetical protein SAMN06296036_12048 [Pseudobacteriovorax antillogorgiicola]